MKIAKITIITGIAVVVVLVLAFAVLGLIFPTDDKSGDSEAETVSTDVAHVLSFEDTAPIGIMGVSEDLVAAAVSEDSVSEDEAVSANETVSDNEPSEVSENEAELQAEGKVETVSENEAAEEEPEPAVPETPDTKAPFFLVYNGSPTIKVGDTFDIHKYMGYADDVDRHVDLEVSGEVNTAEVGTYALQITLRDDAGHTTTQKMNVGVAAELPGGGGGGGKKEEFSDFINTYKTEETCVGIDISRWQEDVDFEKVKAAGCEFVYMRIGGLDDGELYTDRYYAKNIAGAKAAGLMVGIYWHAEESNPQEVKASVDYLMSVLNGVELDFPIAYDWEDFLHFENYGMNISDLNNNLDVFVDEINAWGYKACLYNSKYYLETIWPSAAKHPLWLAHYVSSTNYQGSFFMWQHGCTGRIDGINGDVDLDVLYKGRL